MRPPRHFPPATLHHKESIFDSSLHPVAFPLDDDRYRVVQQAVGECRCQSVVVVKDFRPVLEDAISINDQRSLFIAVADDLEEELGLRKKCFVPEGALICVRFGRSEGEKPQE